MRHERWDSSVDSVPSAHRRVNKERERVSASLDNDAARCSRGRKKTRIYGVSSIVVISLSHTSGNTFGIDLKDLDFYLSI